MTIKKSLPPSALKFLDPADATSIEDISNAIGDDNPQGGGKASFNP